MTRAARRPVVSFGGAAGAGPETHDGSASPQLTVISKDATEDEIAALVVALASIRPLSPPGPKPTSNWASPARSVRPHYSHRPGGWRASSLPR